MKAPRLPCDRFGAVKLYDITGTRRQIGFPAPSLFSRALGSWKEDSGREEDGGHSQLFHIRGLWDCPRHQEEQPTPRPPEAPPKSWSASNCRYAPLTSSPARGHLACPAPQDSLALQHPRPNLSFSAFPFGIDLIGRLIVRACRTQRLPVLVLDLALWVQIPVLPFGTCVTLGRLLIVSRPQFHHL